MTKPEQGATPLEAVLSLWTNGDRSVGIDGFSAEVHFYTDFIHAPEWKQQVKEAFQGCFSELCDEKAYAEWRDELEAREAAETEPNQ